MPNLVRAYRELRGWTLDQLAEKSGLSISQVSKIERGKRGWSVTSLEHLARALGVSVASLLVDSDAWQSVPVFGFVGRGGMVTLLRGKKRKDTLPRRAPTAFGALVALLIQGDSLYPRYRTGDAIFCGKEPSDCKLCLNKECLVHTESGDFVLRTVHPGTRPHRYNLFIHGAAPELDQRLLDCRPVIYTAPNVV